MVSTRDAPNTVKVGLPPDARITFAPKEYANALEDSAWYKSLLKPKQERIVYLVEGLDYGQNGLSMAFPYMLPDDNNYWFAGTMADQFVVNQTADAVKNKSDFTEKTNEPRRRPDRCCRRRCEGRER